MDKRLRNVQQADLTESRVNDDFAHFLKTWGLNILTGILLIAAVAMGVQYYWQKQEEQRDNAWEQLSATAIPESLLEIAEQHRGKDSLSIVAELSAADLYSESLLSGKRFDRDATATDADLTPEVRAEWTKEADRLYAKVAEATKNPTTLSARMFRASALFGRAALAEDAGNLGTAEEYLKEIKALSTDPAEAALAKLADQRLASMTTISTNITFAPRPMLPTAPNVGTPDGATPPPLLQQKPQQPGEIIQKVPGATVKLVPVPPEKMMPIDPMDAGATPPKSTPPAAPPATKP